MVLYQKYFINIISEQLPEGVKLVDFIADLVHLSKEACYRRIRCEVEFTLSEVVVISKALNINLTSLIIREGGEKVTCNLRVLQEENLVDSLIKKLEADINILESFNFKNQCKVFLVCKNIPELLCFNSEGLLKLHLLKMQLNQGKLKPITFDQLELTSIFEKVQKKYWAALEEFKLVVYLGPDIIMGLLHDIEFFSKTNLLTSNNKQQLIQELYDSLAILSNIGSTGKFKDKDIDLYISHMAIEVSQVYLRSKELETTILGLEFPNTLLSFDQSFNATQSHQLNIIRRTSTLITKSGEVEKVAYLNKQRSILDVVNHN